MATPGERLRAWLEATGKIYAAPLHGFLEEVFSAGLDAFMRVMGKSFAPKLKPILDKIEKETTIPPELQLIWDELKNPTGEVSALLANRLAGGLVGGAISSIVDYLLRPVQYGFSYAPGYFLPKPELLIGAYQRGLIKRDRLDELMREYGIDPLNTDFLLNMGEVRFPSEIVSLLWLRDPEKYKRYWDDVYAVAGIEKLEGSEDPRILALQELAYKIPGVQDIIRYVVKEAYSPDIYEAFGQNLEYPSIAEADARKAGIRPGHLQMEWIAHWLLPSAGQGFEMLHRTVRQPTEFSGEPVGEDSQGPYYSVISKDYLDKLLKALDIMPKWREMLTKISWDAPNRVELRMLARYGLVDKAFLLHALRDAGLAEEYRETIADLMLAQGMMTDLPTRYRNKWINSDEVKAELAEAGLSQNIQDRIYKWIVQNAGAERTVAERDLTAAEIIKGVKQNVLTWDEAVQQLIALGYDAAEANYKLAIDVEVAAAVPTTELNTRVDTIRRRRRQRFITRGEEITGFLDLGIDSGLATAYADNDDLRLAKVAAVKPPEVPLAYQTAEGKVKVDSIRLARRQRSISRDEEITELMDLEVPTELAISFADNDELRLAVVKPPVPIVVILLYQTELGKVNVDTFRRARRDRLITRDEEVLLLTDLDMPVNLATAYADNDDLRLTPVKVVVPPPVIPYYQTTAGKVDVDTIRRKRQQRQLYEELTSAQIAQGIAPRLLTGDEAHNEEVRLLKRLDMPDELATAYANNDDLRLTKVTTGGV